MAAGEVAESLLGPDIPPELISDVENSSPDSRKTRAEDEARTAARRALRPPPRVHFEAQDVD